MSGMDNLCSVDATSTVETTQFFITFLDNSCSVGATSVVEATQLS